MSERTLRATMDLMTLWARESGEIYPTIGGGEPTVHPRFWEFLGIIFSYNHPRHTIFYGLVTNGAIKQSALALLMLAKNTDMGFNVSLSQDAFHAPIDSEVISEFQRLKHDIRRVDAESVRPAGRGKAFYNEHRFGVNCGCEGPIIDPKGRIYKCSCKTEQIGTVFDTGPCLDFYSQDQELIENYCSTERKAKAQQCEKTEPTESNGLTMVNPTSGVLLSKMGA